MAVLSEAQKEPLYYIPHYLKVMTKKDVDTRLTSLVPLDLWPAQKYYIENKTNRNVCLKNRQQGFSTAVMADNAVTLFTMPYQNQTIVANDDETAQWLFLTLQRFHRNLPKEIQPTTGGISAKRMKFSILDSVIYCDSAQSESLGIGHTLSSAHLSEMARWPARKAKQLFADVTETVPEGGLITVESTPRGRAGKFFELYKGAKEGDNEYKHFFFAWWWDVTAVRKVHEPLTYTQEEKDLIRYAKLTDDMDLSEEQIMFRREKHGSASLGELAYQEYPENDVDCWLSMEMGCFDAIALRRYYQSANKGHMDGDVTIWKGPIGGERYAIGVDVAAGGARGDYSVASVINIKRNEYVARYRVKLAPDLFGQEVLRLGKRYNDAEIGVERTGHGIPVIKLLLENNYENLYYYRGYNELRYGMEAGPGWVTSVGTKKVMIDSLAMSLRTGDLISYSSNLVDECSNMYWEGQKVATASGYHDDEADAVMIALQLREGAPVIISGNYPKPTNYVTI